VDKPQASRIASIDFGLARLGVALSDPSKIIASPLMTITAEKRSEQTAAKVIRELTLHQECNKYVLEEIIIGLPLLLSGKAGLLADEVKHFIELLKKLTSIPIKTWDERLTTVQAERSMREDNMSRRRRSKAVDTVSAVIILQSYLDFLSIRRL